MDNIVFDDKLSMALSKATQNIDVLKPLIDISNKVDNLLLPITSLYKPLYNTLKLLSFANYDTRILKTLNPLFKAISKDQVSQELLRLQRLVDVSKMFPSIPKTIWEDNAKTNRNQEIMIDEDLFKKECIAVSSDKKLSFRKKQNIIIALCKFLENSSVKYILKILVIILSCIMPSLVFNINVCKHVNIINNYEQIIIIQENAAQKIDLRVVTKENTKLHKKSSSKSAIIMNLFSSDIVEVIEEKKEWLKVKVVDTDEIGWVYKKYTKKPKKNR